ncbi:glycosyltransferase family 2 protein [Anaeromyxobacter paludicola]|uniref:Glycosyl transferase n=1 Tax=Anaeromyxobacter paludicola TaxID=2918171 RepID=A0ABN6N8U3_9BACT|nr:glycosyltransferase family 2 protein [Anaeromyxobacter paludicola]BDG09653.1 glycosyl transferase [Anaeromyxobacter paludicola]
MRVSFVVPTRNQAPFLRRCLDSCLAQGIADAEVLVRDGLSTDGTQEILASYGDRVRWVSKRDSGQAQAVNEGIREARGEVVAWINSDDCYDGPGVVARALAAFERDPALDLAYGEALVVDVEGRPIRPFARREVATARDVLLAPTGPSQPATFFRRALFLEAGGLREDLHYALDYDLWLRLFARARKVERLPFTVARMTFHAGAKSVAAMGTQIAEAVALKRAFARGLRLSPLERLRLEAGIASLRLYRVAVRSGLWRGA